MKKATKAADFKKAAAGDTQESNGKNGNGKKPKAEKVQPEQGYSLLATVDVKKFTRGFLAEFLAFVAKREVVTTAELIAEFNSRQFDGRKVTPLRVRPYVSYCVSQEIFKKAGTH